MTLFKTYRISITVHKSCSRYHTAVHAAKHALLLVRSVQYAPSVLKPAKYQLLDNSVRTH